MEILALKQLLDKESNKRNSISELSHQKPDPLLIARKFKNEKIALFCALFAYGNAKAILSFLEQIDFSIIDASEKEIKKYFSRKYYRFQKGEDISSFVIALKNIPNLEALFWEEYKKETDVIAGIRNVIKTFQKMLSFESHGLKFLIGTPPPIKKRKGVSPYKRWNMFLRWMVRKDNLDMGLWQKIDKSHLLLPLDTHTHKISLKLGILKRKQYDLESVIEATTFLKKLDPTDPIKYDFALYRIGQEKLLN